MLHDDIWCLHLEGMKFLEYCDTRTMFIQLWQKNEYRGKGRMLSRALD